MKTSSFIALIIISLCGGILFYAINQEWVVFQTPFLKKQQPILNSACALNKKQVTLFFWHNDMWNSEKIELIWFEDSAQNIHTILNKLLTLMHEDHMVHKKIQIQSVLVSNTEQAYISFDRNPLLKDATLYAKWVLMESLLKTIRENNIPISSVWFLVNHQPLQDTHLDFSNAWPINGFLN